jgi:surface antigen
MVALLAGILAAPAAADTERKRWLPGQDAAARPGNVGQPGRQVNRRYDAQDRGILPPWLSHSENGRREHGEHVRDYRQYPPGHDAHDRRHDGRHRKDRRREHDHDRVERHYHRYYRDDRRRHEHRRREVRRYYYYTYAFPPPARVIYYPVPYHIHEFGGRHRHYETETDACAGGFNDGGRYVMNRSREPGGMILGGIVGAAIGSQIGGGNGRLAAVGVGTLIGALIGRDVGRSMDAADRAYAAGSFGHAMEYAPACSTITWDNPRSGTSGTVTPTHTYEPEPGRYCREFQQQVMIGGKRQDAYGTACRQPDGSWEIVTEQP